MAACHIRKNLAALRQFPRVALNNIRDLPEAFKPVGAFLSTQVKVFHKSFKILRIPEFFVQRLVFKYKMQYVSPSVNIHEQTFNRRHN